jgi:hypothetical protein
MEDLPSGPVQSTVAAVELQTFTTRARRDRSPSSASMVAGGTFDAHPTTP